MDFVLESELALGGLGDRVGMSRANQLYLVQEAFRVMARGQFSDADRLLQSLTEGRVCSFSLSVTFSLSPPTHQLNSS
jgi:hypothetical protein